MHNLKSKSTPPYQRIILKEGPDNSDKHCKFKKENIFETQWVDTLVLDTIMY